MPAAVRGRVVVWLASVFVAGAAAHEVDHYYLPLGRQLADLGPYFSEITARHIVDAVDKVNARIRQAQGAGAAAELAHVQHPDEIVNAVCAEFPTFVTYIEDIERAVHSDELKRRYPGLLVAWRAVPSVYDNAHAPLDTRSFYLLWRSSLRRIGDAYVGTDKIGHFVHNGLNYYVAYRGARNRGASHEEALRVAVGVGVRDNYFLSEEGLLGAFTSSVRSNGDLAANYLGMLFYLNLTEPVSIRGQTRPPLLERDGPFWRVTPRVRADGDFYSAFFSEHMDEVLNPNVYEPFMYDVIRGRVVRRGADLRAWYADENGATRPAAWFAAKQSELQTYYGADYGHMSPLVAFIDVAGTCYPRGRSPAAALQRAAAEGDEVHIRDLLAQGTAPDTLPSDQGDLPADAGRTALMVALAGAHAEAAQALLAGGAFVNARTAAGQTPLHAAIYCPALISALVQAGAQRDEPDALGRTPLHWAVRAEAEAASAALLTAGCNPNVADCDGETPLFAAARLGNTRLAAMLLDRGASVAPRGRYDTTVLHVAVRAGRPDMVELLLARGALPGDRDEFGCTALHFAAERGAAEVVEVLLRRGAEPRSADLGGTTPLHLAARGRHLEAARLLVAAGADPGAANGAGRTPLSEAAGGPASLHSLLRGARHASADVRAAGVRP